MRSCPAERFTLRLDGVSPHQLREACHLRGASMPSARPIIPSREDGEGPLDHALRFSNRNAATAPAVRFESSKARSLLVPA
jgi:hypothetical protein